jgi:serine/threonine protein phosphatase PrpC
MAESVMCSLHTALTGPSTTTGVWGEDDLTAALQGLFHGAEQECTGLFGDFDGGATLSVCVDRPGRDMWVAHVGDTDICLVELATDACNASMITEDHSPLNMDEFLRMVALCPSANFEYDRQRKDAPHLHIYAQSPQEPCGWKKNPSPKRNVYYKNRANDLASYVSEGGGCASLANTRAIGDFRMKRAVALSAQPFIMRHPALNSSKRLIVASDGFWDSWPTDELLLFCQKHKNFHDVVEALERTHVNTTNKYFGSCSDDTFLYFIQPNDDPPL